MNIAVLLYLIFKNKQVNHPEKTLFISMVILATTFSLYGFHEIITGPNIRLAGFFLGDENYTTYPNAMADLLILTIPIFFYFIQKYKFDKNRYANVVSILLFFTNLTAFWLTQSRGAIIALAVLVGTYFSFELVIEKNPKRFLVGAVLIGLSLVTTITLAGIINSADPYHLDIDERIQSEDPSSKQSLDERLLLWTASKNMIFTTPTRFLLGQGSGEFGERYASFSDSPLSYKPDHPHNIILKIATESGVPAALAFIVWIFAAAFVALRNFTQTSPENRKVWSPLFVGLVGILSHQLVDYNLNFSQLTLLTFSLGGIIANPLNWQSAKQINLVKSNAKKITWLLIAFILILLASQKIYTHLTPTEATQKLATTSCVEESNKNLDAELAYLCLNQKFETWTGPSPSDFSNLLNQHQGLLEVNAHQYVTTNSPEYIYKIYQYLLKTSHNPELKLAFQKYQETYRLEAKKFNDRYGTNLPLDWN